MSVLIAADNIELPVSMLQWLVNACRKINTTLVGRKKEAVNYFNIESAIALFVSLIINVFVLSVFAKGFYGKAEGDIGLENAGQFLGETFGTHMKYIWAVGLLAAGKTGLHKS